MKMTKKIHDKFKGFENDFNNIVLNFDSTGTPFGKQARNSLKLFVLEETVINVKSFRIPNIVNQITYKFFRKSKAQRSYEFACKLMNLGIGTPHPYAYYEFTTPFLFKKSYYLSEHLECDLTYRELTKNLNFPDLENILRAFTRFTHKLHENNINFLDHSPGNTLIKKTSSGYKFYLVDLNRMKFGPMDFETRIKNFSKLTIHKSMIEVMSDEYAKIYGEDYNKVFQLMWNSTQNFQYRYHRRRRLKKALKFWETS